MQMNLCKTKNRNKNQTDLIKSGLEKLKDNINKMSVDEIRIEKPFE